MVLEPEACDQPVHDVTDMIGVRAQVKMLTLIVNEPPESCRFIRTDPARLRQVLLNLLTNAVKYTSQGSVTLRFGAQTVQDNRILLDFEVEDTGIGIAPEDQQRVFELFEQVANTGRKVYRPGACHHAGDAARHGWHHCPVEQPWERPRLPCRGAR